MPARARRSEPAFQAGGAMSRTGVTRSAAVRAVGETDDSGAPGGGSTGIRFACDKREERPVAAG